jgi:DNA-binding transcriptional LysR family regulator
MMNAFDLRCFLILARTLSFTGTAQELFLSQQAVSQRISRLEQDLGFPLFVRNRNYVKLTRAGERCYAFLKPAEEQYQAMVEECRKEFAEQSKVLQVGYQNMLDWGPFLNAAQDALRVEAPGLTLLGELFEAATLSERLQQRQVDMIIIYERFAPKLDGLVKLEITRMPLLLLVSAKNPKVTDRATYRDFVKEPFVEDMFANEQLPETLRRARKTAAMCGLEPSEIIVVPNRDSANIAAELGQGIIIGTEFSWARKSADIRQYKTEAEEALICLWNEDEENALVPKYAKYLQEAYRARENVREEP